MSLPRTRAALLAIVICAIASRAQVREPQASAIAPPHSSWKLVWSDEFDGVNGSLPEVSKWTFETGGNGWGNRELEYYTARSVNAHQEDGSLVITANQEVYT